MKPHWLKYGQRWGNSGRKSTTGIRWISVTKSRSGTRYVITRTENGFTKYYYSSKSLDNCKIVLHYLLTHDWNMPPELPPKVPYNNGQKKDFSNYTGIKYVMMDDRGNYCLRRRGVHYGTYSTIIDAVKDKLFWESIDWDMDLLYYH